MSCNLKKFRGGEGTGPAESVFLNIQNKIREMHGSALSTSLKNGPKKP